MTDRLKASYTIQPIIKDKIPILIPVIGLTSKTFGSIRNAFLRYCYAKIIFPKFIYDIPIRYSAFTQFGSALNIY